MTPDARAITAERHLATAVATAAALIMAVAALLTAALVVLAAAAQAQTPPTIAGQPTDPDPLNAGGIVFLCTSAVIFGGALVLYLRYSPARRAQMRRLFRRGSPVSSSRASD
jgi:hypothetical protein